MRQPFALPVLVAALVTSVATSQPDEGERSLVAWEAGHEAQGELVELARGEGFSLEARMSVELPEDEDGTFESGFEYANALSYDGPFEMEVSVSDADGAVLGEWTYSDTAENATLRVDDILEGCTAGRCERTVYIDAEVVRGEVGVEWRVYVGASDVDRATTTEERDARIVVVEE